MFWIAYTNWQFHYDFTSVHLYCWLQHLQISAIMCGGGEVEDENTAKNNAKGADGEPSKYGEFLISRACVILGWVLGFLSLGPG